MTDIDLTPMNEATARALFAEQYAERFINAQDGLTVEQLAQYRIEVRQHALTAWDRGVIQHETMIEYRELALAATLTTWKDVARQAWKQGYSAGNVDAYHGGAYGRQANPYEEVRP
ncbi:hypothetical protein E7Z53_07970 [Kocuria salina]|uniref:hypothetical protein n=1 Tax=Kocuria salina TaxID=1929416 RepID=UPI0015939191|nr:hypothetical protein [Kocuria salina]NVC23379.1 hypothetical protein [Kocuria salina]